MLTAHVARARVLWIRHERRVTAAAFIAGFVIDALTLRRVDLWIENLVFVTHLVIIAASIILFHAYDSGVLAGRRGRRLYPWLPAVMQFSFGALMSGFFIFYSRSGALATSWPFLLLLLALLIGNERLRHRYGRLTFQLSLFFFIAFSYAIFLVPVVVRSLGVHTFLAGGIFALLSVWLVTKLVRRVAPAAAARNQPRLVYSIATLYVLFHILYFFNIIPPIPLALKDIGLFHSVVKTASYDYLVTYEPVPWYDVRGHLRPTFHRSGSEPVYVFSSVFAPTAFSIPIIHEWAYFDEGEREWIVASEIGFPITGGADGGYRGYSLKQSVFDGTWRVTVRTEREQVIGRITFSIETVSVEPQLENTVL